MNSRYDQESGLKEVYVLDYRERSAFGGLGFLDTAHMSGRTGMERIRVPHSEHVEDEAVCWQSCHSSPHGADEMITDWPTTVPWPPWYLDITETSLIRSSMPLPFRTAVSVEADGQLAYHTKWGRPYLILRNLGRHCSTSCRGERCRPRLAIPSSVPTVTNTQAVKTER